MNNVEPIRDKRKIDAMKKYLLGCGNIRNYTMVVVGLNSALRIGDLLGLTWGDVFDFQTSQFKEHVTVKERKTGKENKFYLNTNAQNALQGLKNSLGDILPCQHIFCSRQGHNRPIDRTQAYRIIKESAQAVGVKERIGCHSLRKSFGYWCWRSGVQPAVIMDLFHHSSISVTKRYLGISQDDRDQVYRTVNL